MKMIPFLIIELFKYDLIYNLDIIIRYINFINRCSISNAKNKFYFKLFVTDVKILASLQCNLWSMHGSMFMFGIVPHNQYQMVFVLMILKIHKWYGNISIDMSNNIRGRSKDGTSTNCTADQRGWLAKDTTTCEKVVMKRVIIRNLDIQWLYQL